MANKPFPTPEAAETAFYDALERASLEGMTAVWDDSDEIACIHPGGQRLSGRAAVLSSWRQIFAGGAHLHFSITHRHSIADETLAIHMVDEHIVSGSRRYPPVITTNIYRRSGAGWRMVLHHACPSPPATGAANENGRLH
ncbi:MAG: nuclear transport factor 2 family protein [Gammaproteobacteria bacterium]